MYVINSSCPWEIFYQRKFLPRSDDVRKHWLLCKLQHYELTFHISIFHLSINRWGVVKPDYEELDKYDARLMILHFLNQSAAFTHSQCQHVHILFFSLWPCDHCSVRRKEDLPGNVIWWARWYACLHTVRTVQAQCVKGVVLVTAVWVMETVQIHIGFRCCSAVEFWRLLPLVFTDALMVIPYKVQSKHWFHTKIMWQERNLLAAQAFWTPPQAFLHCDQGTTTLFTS